jgi:hypothetical protein
MENVLDKSCRKNKNTHFMFNNFLSKIAPFIHNVENLVDTEEPKMTSQHGTYSLHAREARL